MRIEGQTMEVRATSYSRPVEEAELPQSREAHWPVTSSLPQAEIDAVASAVAPLAKDIVSK